MMRPTPLVRLSDVGRLVVCCSTMPDHLQSVNHDQDGGADGSHDQVGPTSFIGYSPKERDWGQDHCGENVTPEFPCRPVEGDEGDQGVGGIHRHMQLSSSKRQ